MNNRTVRCQSCGIERRRVVGTYQDHCRECVIKSGMLRDAEEKIRERVTALASKHPKWSITFGYIGNLTPQYDDRGWYVWAKGSLKYGGCGTGDLPLMLANFTSSKSDSKNISTSRRIRMFQLYMLARISQATVRGLPVALGYAGTTRLVQPFKTEMVRYHPRTLIVKAKRLDSGEFRSYRLDRIESAMVIDNVRTEPLPR